MKRVICLALATLLLSACAAFSPYSETPSVSLTSINLAPDSADGMPSFRVGLRVVNPNKVELPLVGMSYSVNVEGARILNGATANLPQVPAYGTADFAVDLVPDLFGGFSLLSGLMSGENFDGLEFEFKARLDMGGWRPDLHIEEAGHFRAGTASNPDGFSFERLD